MLTTVDTLDAVELGYRHRALRIVRREWLFDAAERLGVTAGDLSAFERGEIAMDWVREHPQVTMEIGL